MIPIRVLIVGAGLIAYGCAYSALKEGYSVFIADHTTEFGLPNVWPSLLKNKENIPLNFETERGFEGKEEGYRHEWIMKSMNIILAVSNHKKKDILRDAKTNKSYPLYWLLNQEKVPVEIVME